MKYAAAIEVAPKPISEATILPQQWMKDICFT
jgi:hypothetical protein